MPFSTGLRFLLLGSSLVRSLPESSTQKIPSMNLLKGIRVVELSHMVMGPTTGLILGDLGADVIKVEPIGGDKTRNLPGSGAGYFAMFNRNKRSICLDLKSAAGREVLSDLVTRADVMTENFRPGALDELGFGFAQVKAINPNIVYQSSKGFLSGPYEDRTAMDEMAQMMGGLAYMTGPSGRPLRAGASVIDIGGGMFGVIGILAALVSEGKGNAEEREGMHITSSLFETTAFLVGQHMAQHAVTGVPAEPMPERVSAWSVYDVFDTADGQLFVGIVSDSQWRTLCQTFGLTAWAEDQTLTRNDQRVERRGEIIPRLRSIFKRSTLMEAVAKLGNAGLPFAPIMRPQDLTTDEHLVANGFHDLRLPEIDKPVRLPRLPIEVDGERAELHHDLPSVGANTRAILSEIGYEEGRIASLFGGGVVA